MRVHACACVCVYVLLRDCHSAFTQSPPHGALSRSSPSTSLPLHPPLTAAVTARQNDVNWTDPWGFLGPPSSTIPVPKELTTGGAGVGWTQVTLPLARASMQIAQACCDPVGVWGGGERGRGRAGVSGRRGAGRRGCYELRTCQAFTRYAEL